MRNFKTTIIALVCLIVAISAFFAVKILFLDKEDVIESQPTAETKVALFDFDYKKVVKIESKQEEFFSLYLADGKWNSSSHVDMTVYNNAIDSFVREFSGLSGYIIKDFEKLSDFGISENSFYTKLTLDDGTEFAVRFGVEDSKGTLRYVSVEGADNAVYGVGALSANSIMLTRNHLVRLEAFYFSYDSHPYYFSMKKDGKLVLSANAVYKAAQTEGERDVTTWTVLEPIEVPAENDKFNNLVKSLRDIPLIELFDPECEDLSKYGLDRPAIEYGIVYENDLGKKETMSLALGGKNSDNSKYYCIVNDDKTSVYTVNSSYFITDINVEDYIDGKPFYEMYDVLDTVTIYFAGEEHTMKYVFGKENKEERFFDGVFVHGEDSYQDENMDTPEDKFNHLIASMYLISITTVDANEPAEKGELLYKAVYKKIDGSKITVECFKRDDTTAYIYKDGKYYGGYMKTAVRLYGDYEDYGIKSSLIALKESMK